jgi:hypothetical protein
VAFARSWRKQLGAAAITPIAHPSRKGYGATIWMKKPERQSEMNLAHGIDIIAVV